MFVSLCVCVSVCLLVRARGDIIIIRGVHWQVEVHPNLGPFCEKRREEARVALGKTTPVKRVLAKGSGKTISAGSVPSRCRRGLTVVGEQVWFG